MFCTCSYLGHLKYIIEESWDEAEIKPAEGIGKFLCAKGIKVSTSRAIVPDEVPREKGISDLAIAVASCQVPLTSGSCAKGVEVPRG